MRFASFSYVDVLIVKWLITYALHKLPLKVISLIECLTAVLESVDLISSGQDISLCCLQNSTVPLVWYIKVAILMH